MASGSVLLGIFLNWLERRVDRLAHTMEDAATQVFTLELSVMPQEEEIHEPARFRAAAARG
jgi:biopolymer transport protein ExbB